MTQASLYEEARTYIPGGVNSPVRAFTGVGGEPVFINRAQGPFLWDESGKQYIDYVGSWGPMVLGHAHPEVISAVKRAIDDGLSFGAPTRIETALAKRLCELVRSVQKIRMVSSGTEATMSAIRLARGFTGRDKILKFEGCYHGHADSLLVKAGSGALTLGVPTSPGVPASLAQHTITTEYNSLEQARRVFQKWGAEIAAVIVEPVAGNMNCIPPVPGFLAGLRDLCNEFDVVLIFDEVMTGFRVGLTGAQGVYDVTPDLSTFGKVIGGGMPVGAFGGRADIMDHVAPDGPVYQAGTLSGNPVAMTAGLKTLELISEPGFFDRLATRTRQFAEGLSEVCKRNGIGVCVQYVGGMFGVFFTDRQEVTSFAQVMDCDVDRFKAFFHACLKEGVYLAPSAFEAGFVSAAHSESVIEATLAAAERACRQIR